MTDDVDSESVQFRLIRFNPRRLRPNCSGAAEVEITDDSGTFRLWMARRDVERNIIEFGRHPGLVAALEAYRNRVEIREVTPSQNS